MTERTVLDAIEAAGRGVVLMTPDGVIRYVNQTLADMFERKAEEFIGRDMMELADRRDHQTHAARMQDRRQGQDSLYEVTLRAPGVAPVHCSVHAISLTGEGGSFFGTLGIISRLPPPDDTDGKVWIQGLSNRERQVLEGLLTGERPRTIAERLEISVHTARNHVKAIYRKLGVRSRVELLLQLGPRRD